jgi:hypothetical protein
LSRAVLGSGGNFWLAVLGAGRLTRERVSGQTGSGTCDRWLPGWPGRLHVLVDLDTRLALNAGLLHRVAQLGAAEERFGVGRGGEAVGNQQVGSSLAR